METWELIARESVRDLIARYNANGDTGRFDQMMELFAPDAVMVVDGDERRGRDEIRTIFTGAKGRWGGKITHLRHFTATHQIDILSPTEARSRCYFQVLMDHGLDHWGRYVDRFTAIDGRWYFAHRVVTIDGRTTDLA